MANAPSVQSVDTTEEYHHVRFRDPDEFDEIRTPDWATAPAESVCEGSEVRTGHVADDGWRVQSVLVPTDTVEDEDDARERAVRIVEKIDSEE